MPRPWSQAGNAWYWELQPDLKPGEVFTLWPATASLKGLAVLRHEGAHSSIVREAQELIELAL
jgi:hypothetical protein